MEHRANLEEGRIEANAYLRNLLVRSNTKSPEDIARSITNLAFEDGNPVRDLFLSAASAARAPNTSPTQAVKPRSSVKFLRLARRENKTASPENKTPVPIQPTVASSSTKIRSDEGQLPTQPSYPAAETPNKEAGPVLFTCIICNEDMSSKGVCKRHLEEQHVSPKIFKCERCGEEFATKAEAKKHCNRCGLGVFTWTIVKPQAKKIYASEFTEEWFSSKSSYLEHLLRLSKKGAARLRPSLHCKLRALLGHQTLRPHVDQLSQRLYSEATAWRTMRWTDEQLQRAVTQLEDAAVVYENGSIEFGRPTQGAQNTFDVVSFLQDLFNSSTLSVSSQLQRPSQDAGSIASSREHRSLSIATSMSGPTTSPMADAFGVPQTTMDQLPLEEPIVSQSFGSADGMDQAAALPHDLKVKRHLSDDSRFYQPPREPPGPRAAPIHFHDPFNAAKQEAPELPMPDLSSIHLPYRSSERSVDMEQTVQHTMNQMQSYPSLSLVDIPPAAAASETTLVSNHHEPKFQEVAPINYTFWNPEQNLNYVTGFEHLVNGGVTYQGYQHPTDASMRTPSIATDQTCVVDMVEVEPKLENFVPLTTYPAAFGPYILNTGDQQQFHNMNP